MVHKYLTIIREHSSTGGYPGYPVVLVVSGCVMNPVSVMPRVVEFAAPARLTAASGDCAAPPRRPGGSRGHACRLERDDHRGAAGQ